MKIRLTAVEHVASAPNPYTVSVGNATVPPFWMISAASVICDSFRSFVVVIRVL